MTAELRRKIESNEAPADPSRRKKRLPGKIKQRLQQETPPPKGADVQRETSVVQTESHIDHGCDCPLGTLGRYILFIM